MSFRRAVIILFIAVLCALATPTKQSEAKAACFYPFVRITQYWYPNSCGGQPYYPGQICNDVLTLAGESGVDCDGNAWSWGNNSSSLYKTYRREWCEPICE
jgi:hypothetical protein